MSSVRISPLKKIRSTATQIRKDELRNAQVLSRYLAFIRLNDILLFQDIALMDEQEREGFIKKIGISADDSDETDEDEDEDDPEHHKYNCKKCQVSNRLSRRNSAVTWSSTYPCVPHK